MTRSKEAALSIDRTRRLVLLSVWTVVLLGVPLWWKTTRVYRAELPQEDIEKWSRWEPCRPSFPLKIQFHVSNSKPLHIDSQHIDKELSARKGTPNPPSTDLHDNLFSFLTHTQPFQPWAGSTFSQIPSQHSPEPGTYDFYLAPTTDKEGTRALIKSQRQGFIQVETWDEHHIVKAAVDTIEAIFGPQEKVLKKAGAGTAEKKGKDQLRFVKYAPGYQLTFSLFSGDASNGVRGWRVQEAINAYLTPFLRSMSVISKFSIESQVQHYASLTFEPQVDPLKKEHFLTPDSLSNFINAAEWSLASTVSSYPALNFLVYIPKPSESPLVIKQAPGMASTTDSFLIPRWGGITILNHASHDGLSHDSHNETVPQAKDEQTVISVKELEPVMNVFLSQLRDLLGVPELSSLVKANAKIPIQFQRHGHAAVPTAWELDYLLRLRWAENVVDSLSTLGSLARLVADTPNMVVLDPIHKDVVDALKDIEASCQLMSSQAYVSALARSRDGLEKAEAAFFDPTMVSMLYFPDEHKYAIYMPLFVPISVPLVMAVLRELKKMKDAKRAAAKKEKEDESSATSVAEGKAKVE